MGRKKAALPRKRIGRNYAASASELRPDGAAGASATPLGNASAASIRGLANVKLEPEAMATDPTYGSVMPSAGAKSRPPQPSMPFPGLEPSIPVPSGREGRARSSREAYRAHGTRRKRRSGSDGVIELPQGDDGVSGSEAEEDMDARSGGQEMVTIAVVELEKWQQKVVFHVEDHYANEQLKRIAEFGRVHANLVQEAKQYVANLETQLRTQLEHERTVLRAHAEEFVAKVTTENEVLRQRIDELEEQADSCQSDEDAPQQVQKLQEQHEQQQSDRKQPAPQRQQEDRQFPEQEDSDMRGEDDEDGGEVLVGNSETCPSNPSDACVDKEPKGVVTDKDADKHVELMPQPIDELNKHSTKAIPAPAPPTADLKAIDDAAASQRPWPGESERVHDPALTVKVVGTSQESLPSASLVETVPTAEGEGG